MAETKSTETTTVNKDAETDAPPPPAENENGEKDATEATTSTQTDDVSVSENGKPSDPKETTTTTPAVKGKKGTKKKKTPTPMSGTMSNTITQVRPPMQQPSLYPRPMYVYQQPYNPFQAAYQAMYPTTSFVPQNPNPPPKKKGRGKNKTPSGGASTYQFHNILNNTVTRETKIVQQQQQKETSNKPANLAWSNTFKWSGDFQYYQPKGMPRPPAKVAQPLPNTFPEPSSPEKVKENEDQAGSSTSTNQEQQQPQQTEGGPMASGPQGSGPFVKWTSVYNHSQSMMHPHGYHHPGLRYASILPKDGVKPALPRLPHKKARKNCPYEFKFKVQTKNSRKKKKYVILPSPGEQAATLSAAQEQQGVTQGVVMTETEDPKGPSSEPLTEKEVEDAMGVPEATKELEQLEPDKVAESPVDSEDGTTQQQSKPANDDIIAEGEEETTETAKEAAEGEDETPKKRATTQAQDGNRKKGKTD